MSKNLLIVESPSKARTIKKFLGSNYKVAASVGHLRDLPKSKLGIDIENDFEPNYITIRGKGKVIKELKKEAKKADKIYLATDPDREGEAISWHIANILKLDDSDKIRVVFNEITKNAVKNAVKSPRNIDFDLVNAQQARRLLDRLVGYKISPLLWKKIERGLSAGRVQSVAVKLVCDREATGYGLIYFMKEMLDHHKIDLKDKTIAISGSGNVAIYACEKAQQFGGKVIAMSDSKGYIVDSNGINLDTIKQIKEVERKRISEYIEYHPNAEYHENQQDLWSVKCDIALPCAAQNDINLESAKKIVANGTLAVGEGANMPCTNDAINYFLENNVLLAPAKAANAGGVATSALEMSQNSMRLSWSFEEVNRRLNEIMVNIFSISKEAAIEYNMEGNYVAGANIAGFLRVAHAISDQGII